MTTLLDSFLTWKLAKELTIEQVHYRTGGIQFIVYVERRLAGLYVHMCACLKERSFYNISQRNMWSCDLELTETIVEAKSVRGIVRARMD
jgi:hypothetical protein